MSYIAIQEIEIENFKGLRKLKIEGLGTVNFFIGKNNCGKTSILEALNAFFCKPYFSGNLMPPPSITHYDKDGNSFIDTKITIKFQLPENFYDKVGDPHEREILRTKYGTCLSVSKKGMQPDVDMEHIDELYIVENGTEVEPAPKHILDILVLEKIRTYYSDRIIFSSAIDGFRTSPDMGKYYNARHNNAGQDTNDVFLRKKIASFASELDNARNSDREYFAQDYLERQGKFFPIFSKKLDIRNKNIVVKFGEKEKIKSISVYGQGDGELDTLELLRGLDILQFGDKESGYKLCIMDEPENHKHPSLQRKILDAIIEVAVTKERQFFICTHSTTFVSRPLDSRVYLITKDENSDENSAQAIASSSTAKELKRELGLLNVDYFFSNAILFVEGETEAEVFPALFKFYKTDEHFLGLKIVNVGGNDKVNINRLKETLELLKDTDIKPIIILDKENDAEKNREDILRVYGNLFSEPILQYHLWDSSFFVNALPSRIVLAAFNRMLDDHGCKDTPTMKFLESVKKSGKSIENFLQEHYMKKLQSSLSKPALGRYIAKEIDDISEQERGKIDGNKVFKHTKSIVGFMEEMMKRS